MVSRILAFRPASTVERLARRSAACPVSPREVVTAAPALAVVPVVRAPIAGVARGALVAAKELQSALGLALPPGVAPEAWFAAVTRAADELAAGLPIVLAAEVTVPGDGAMQLERAAREGWRLVDAGVTHLAVDVSRVAPGERGRVVADVGRAAVERGAALDAILPLADAAARGPAFLDALDAAGAPLDLASVVCPAPRDREEARLQAGALARVSQALGGIPVMRRGPVTPELLDALQGGPVRLCDDGGAASAHAMGVIPFDLLPARDGEDETRATPLEAAAAELSDEAGERLEARAYVEAVAFIERLGAAGSALALTRALERRLDDRG